LFGKQNKLKYFPGNLNYRCGADVPALQITLAVFFCLLAAAAGLLTGCKQLLSAIRK
jgi:hypothetical protein